MSQLVTIGRFAQLTGLTPSALRFYDETGLLRPAAVDSDNGYRYYDKEQTLRAERVRLLRSLEVPVEDVRIILRDDNATTYFAYLEGHRRELEIRIAAQQRALATLDLLRAHGELPYQVRVKTLPEQLFLFKRFLVTLEDIDRTREQGFRELHTWLKERNVTPAGLDTMRVINEDIEVKNQGLDLLVLSSEERWTSRVDLGIALPYPVKLELPLESSVWPATQVAYVIHNGPYEPLHLAAHTARTWVFENGYTFSGPKREVYNRGPSETLERNQFCTEVQYPVSPIKAP